MRVPEQLDGPPDVECEPSRLGADCVFMENLRPYEVWLHYGKEMALNGK